jgi:SAM-dependent methyltransferase
MSRRLLMEGYTVHGLDISADMIRVAKKQNSEFIERGKADFYVDNVTSFNTGIEYDLIISTFDSLNHLDNLQELTSAFKQAYGALKPNGVFIFDLNTSKGLNKWDFIDVEDNKDTVFIMHGGYDKSEKRAYTRVYGFHHLGDNKWSKFDQLFTNQVFQMDAVYRELEHVGFSQIEFRNHEKLEELVPHPEEEDRVLIIARK